MSDEDDTGSDEGNTSEDPGEGESQMIPKERLDAVLGQVRGLRDDITKVREDNANLRGRLEATPAATAQKEYTSAELTQAVLNQEISQADADTIRDTQLENRIVAKVAETVATTTATQARATTVQADMARYSEAYPDIKIAGTELRNKVEEEFAYLTGTLGHPADASTEVIAVRAVVGPTSRIGKIKKAEPLREVDEQGGSGGDNPPNDGNKKVKLTADEKAFYAPQVGKGKMYSSWDDVHVMMDKYSNSRLREKMQRLA